MADHLNVLIVGDNDVEAKRIARVLTESGISISVQRVDDVEGCRLAMRQFRPDIILSDYSPARFNGLSPLQLARETCPEVPFLFVAEARGEEVAVEAIKSGASDYVLKDNLSRLAPSIRHAIQTSKERGVRRLAAEALRRQEELLRTIMDNIPLMIAYIDSSTRLRWVNQYWEQTVGWSVDDLHERDMLEEFYPDPEQRARVAEFIKAATGKWADFRLRRKDGTYVQTRWVNVPLSDGSNIGIGEDITERKQSEEALVEQASLASLSADIGTALSGSESLEKMLQRCADLISDRLQSAHVQIWTLEIGDERLDLQASAGNASDSSTEFQGGNGRRIRIGQQAAEQDMPAAFRADIRRAREAGMPFFSAYPLVVAGRPTGMLTLFTKKTLTDSCSKALSLIANAIALGTQHRRDYEELRAGQEKLKILSRKLISAQEMERRSIARELHDEVGQSLTGMNMMLRATSHAPEAAPVAGTLKECMEIVSQVLQQVRELSLDLRPSLLDDLNLVEALRWYLSRQTKHAGVEARLESDIPSEVEIKPDLKTVCFRVTQEAVTNAVRHARAGRVVVSLRKEDSWLTLEVDDDGVGFDVDAARKRAALGESLGLLSMQERVLLAGGTIDIESSSECGTSIRVMLPLR